MAKQTPIDSEKGALVADKTPTTPRAFVKRVRNTISTNIGLYEIRMNLFLWWLFRLSREKKSQPTENAIRPKELNELVY